MSLPLKATKHFSFSIFHFPMELHVDGSRPSKCEPGVPAPAVPGLISPTWEAKRKMGLSDEKWFSNGFYRVFCRLCLTLAVWGLFRTCNQSSPLGVLRFGRSDTVLHTIQVKP